ncbi:MAG: hypothetical protein ABSC11_13340, partial [Smithella sp.]
MNNNKAKPYLQGKCSDIEQLVRLNLRKAAPAVNACVYLDTYLIRRYRREGDTAPYQVIAAYAPARHRYPRR